MAATARKVTTQGSQASRKGTKKQSAQVINLFGNQAQDSLLSEEERQELVLEFRIKARKLGRSILRKWHARLDLEEVDSVVDLSLCEAVKRFDPSKGASFMTFLYYHLKGNLIRTVSSAANANVLPGSDPESDYQSGENVVNAQDVVEALSGTDASLPDETLLKKELVALSEEACSRLDPLEQEVIERIYHGGQQLMDIANSLGYSRCHISRVKKKALESLQQDINHSLDLQAEKRGDDVRDQMYERQLVHRRRPRSKKAQEAQEAQAA
ncbi:MAG: sigma-70 family RNA polymerase sigma factor [Bdellovibrionales bacterium]|nr:sigma-70 family RNA polymerase sigma factor [Bdellovibrionales bacterium]